MGASGSMIGLIFGIYPLVVFVVAPVIGVLVSIASMFVITICVCVCVALRVCVYNINIYNILII